jgi:hypothetical protein
MSDEDVYRVAGDGRTTVGRPRTPPLPATISDLLAGRKSLRTRSLNDDVDDIHVRLWEDVSYRKYFEPIWREDTIEGSFIADDISAAMMVRQFAIDHDVHIAARAKLHSIVHSLHVVCKRLSISRKERQGMIGDQFIGRSDDNNDGYGK